MAQNSPSILDVEMKDSSAVAMPNNASPLPGNGVEYSQTTQNQTPARGSPHPIAAPPMAPPTVPNPHGAPVRIYLNSKVTPHLLEGVKYLAAHEPEKPLKWLAEYLQKKSEEVEGP
ncbi:hypothetical protein BT63DRAFT_19003 [Microthyrium microscopicum]|uniref:COMPASS complex subunit Sdc1 n=1 Tax=Microthyrium microscopicum TaxID=703497 RepID=A0A6A6UUV7_9PEZI|nr:hypothetical protein BT63DRAFT_19003 [Microthyrium microscopicum]